MHRSASGVDKGMITKNVISLRFKLSRVVMAAVIKPESVQTLTGSSLDRAGICVSTVCLIQCLLLPVLLVISPLTTLGVFGEEIFHLALLGLIAPISLLAFGLGYRQHRNRRMLTCGLIGLGLVTVSTLFGHELLSPLASALLTSLGGLFLIIGHWLNLRSRRRFCLRAGI